MTVIMHVLPCYSGILVTRFLGRYDVIILLQLSWDHLCHDVGLVLTPK